MQTKMIEIRDNGTCIAALAIRMIPDGTRYSVEYRFMHREGYPEDGSYAAVVLMKLSDQKATADPYKWSALDMGLRTMQCAHNYIKHNWDQIKSGQVVDVEFILGERTSTKTAEIGGVQAEQAACPFCSGSGVIP